MTLLERRSLETQFDISATANGFRFTGYAAKYGTRSHDLGGFVETIQTGAFTRAIGEGQDVRALINHDAGLILGRTTSGTLKLSEDSTGLHYEVDAPDTSYARDLSESMKRGDVTQSSFAFRTRADDWAKEGRTVLRTLIEHALATGEVEFSTCRDVARRARANPDLDRRLLAPVEIEPGLYPEG